jgi:hypothetical protein
MRRRGRGRRRALVIPHPGDLVIDGNVRARLLGLRLLELDAHVVVGNAHARPATTPAAGVDGARGVVTAGEAVDSDALPLARAQRLLVEGSSVLAEARRIH